MSLRRQLGVSFVVQGVGAATLLLGMVWLGAAEGPVVQGGFNRVKSEVEFVVALALFGLPQALFYFIKSGRIGARAAMRCVLGCTCVAAPIAGAFYLLRGTGGGWMAGLFVATVMAAVGHGLLRGLLLIDVRTTWFNAVTAGPQVLILVGIGVVIAMDASTAPSAWLWIFLGAFASVGIVSLWRLTTTPVVPIVPASEPRHWRGLMHYGLATWIVAVLSTAAIVFMQHWVQDREGPAALGRFTLASTLAQVPLTPIAYAAPLLLRRWMNQPGGRASRQLGALVFAALLAAAALVGVLAVWWPDLGLGASYSGLMPALAVLLLGGAAEAASRVLTIQASATGMPWVAVRAEVMRWSVLGIGWLAPLPHGLLPLCAVWSTAAIAAALVFVWHGRAEGLAR